MVKYDLNGQIAIVTGASSGNGRGIAIELANYGAEVICIARREEKLKELMTIIEGYGGKCVYYVADVTDIDTLKKVFTDIIKKKGKIDLLVNNAGQNKAIGNTWDLNPELMWDEITVNTKGTVVATCLAVEQMVKQNSGRVINIAGGGTVKPHVFSSAYSASKVAVTRYTETVALELESIGSKVKVFSVRPGLVINERTIELANSEVCKKYWPDIVEMIKNNNANTPEMVGNFIGFIASGAIDGHSGKCLYIGIDKEKLIKENNEIKNSNKYTLRIIE